MLGPAIDINYIRAAKTRLNDLRGFTMIELLSILALVAVVTSVAISNLKELENPLADASFQVSHYLRLARSRAISKTVAVIVTPVTSGRLEAATAPDCNGDQTPLSSLTLDLPDETSLGSTSWQVCFNQRGLADANVVFSVTGVSGRSKTIEIALGGGVQIR